MSNQQRRVVIVDDHPVFRATVRDLLERRGFAVVGEADGAHAGLQAVEASAPDAVVLDVQLPDGNGIDVCRMLTEANPGLTVLLVSADGDQGRWASDCGAIGFLPKAQLGSADLVGLLSGGEAEDLADRAAG
jgi:DNA-binding NarL/FixJ family response regulator